jgi:hypothetical protein
MERTEIIAQLNSKYNEIFPQYFEMLMKKKEHPEDLQIKKMFDCVQSNLEYIEKYLSLVEIADKEKMKIALEKNNYIKGLTDVLYDLKEPTNFGPNPKIEIIEENSGAGVDVGVGVGVE